MNEPVHGPLDLDEARVLLARAVATKGRDFVYRPGGSNNMNMTNCLYVTRGEAIQQWGMSPVVRHGREDTGCLIGVALDLRGERWHHLQKFQREPVSSIASDYPDRYFTHAAARYLNEAQAAQDGGFSWGEAFDKAEESLVTA